MSFFLKKRFYLLLLIVLLIALFYKSHWLGRMLYPISYQSDIVISSEQHDIDPLFVAAVIRVESNYDPDKLSAKEATGLMQLMPQTAEWIAQQHHVHLDRSSLHRPDINIDLGAWYLAYLQRLLMKQTGVQTPDKYDKIALVAGAYNAGPGNVIKWLEQQTWSGEADRIADIPFGETRHYIQRVLYYYKKYEDLYEL
ncbi:lytic transglycosylase domain-containing protein [Marinicrinis sediminis]|uniref:Lytic transglycosylase domain-containing protein n=1 Tax=Marinicrinis sediminis TaxID=1652465 RepID=A0ABW5R9H7_9BACL